MNIATILIGLTMAGALVMALRGSRGHASGLESWSVGGRSFGAVLVFLLMAGEIYTTFTFLGASGYAYGKGAASYYILCYLTLAYVPAYWLLPAIWRYAHVGTDWSRKPVFSPRKYESRALGLLVTCRRHHRAGALTLCCS